MDVLDGNPLSLEATSTIPSSLLQPQLQGLLGEYVAHKNQIDEYKDEMLQHLLLMERLGRPSLEQMQMQPEITLRMRPLLLDFLMDVINKLGLSKSTFPLTVNLIDRYALVRVVKKKHYQLLGLTALWVACKNLDAKTLIPRLDDLCRYCCRCYDRSMFLEMENHLLKSLDWLVDTPTVDTFVDVYIYLLSPYRFLAGSKMSHRECTTVKIVATYLCELAHFYPHIHFHFLIPQMALAAILMSSMVLRVCSNDDLPGVLTHILDESGLVFLTMPQLDHAFLLLTKVSNRPPPSLKTKYFSDDSNCLNLAAILSPLNDIIQKDLPLQLPTPLELQDGALTPTSQTNSSPLPLTPQSEDQLSSLVLQTAYILNNLTTGGSAGTNGVPVAAAVVVGAENTVVQTLLASEELTGEKSSALTAANPAAAFPLPSLLPGQEGVKRKVDAEEAPAKRPKLVA